MMNEQAVLPLLDMLKQETLQSVVHDLRTPMTVIKGYLHLLLSGSMGTLSDEQTLMLQRSVGPLEDLILLTDNLLQAGTLDRNQIELRPSVTEVDPLIAETVEFYQLPFKQRDMQLYREGNTLGIRLMVDPFWMKRVLHNLIWNAFKFTPNHGKVTLHVRHVTHKNGGLEIAVLDTGRGIPADKLRAIFEKHKQAAPKKDREMGSGLGLWIAKRVMELHGGTIQVSSKEGQGSQFILYFPPATLL
jgi:signal transduction histidine kinase